MNNKDIIVIDVESNGLYGQPFCVGAVLMDRGGRVLEDFLGRCPIDGEPNDYISNEILPNIMHHDEDYKSLIELEEGFIEWFSKVCENKMTTVLVDAGFPVDYAFLADLGRRSDNYGELWRSISPHSIIEIESVLASANVNPGMHRREYAEPLIGVSNGIDNDPIWNAEISGLCFIRAMRAINV